MEDSESLQRTTIAICSVFFAIGTISMFVRCYTRFVLRDFWWDDWVMLFGIVFNAGQQTLLYLFVSYGAGLHTATVAQEMPEKLADLPKLLFGEYMIYPWMHCWIKMCFLLFYLRLCSERNFAIAVYCVMAYNIASTIALWLLYGLQCIPLDALFHPAAHPDVKCLPSDVIYFVPYPLQLIADIAILVLPLPVILKLQAPLRRRLQILAVICLGGSAVLVCALRVIVVLEFVAAPDDITFVLAKLVVMTCVELQVAIVTANMPAVKAFFVLWAGRGGRGLLGRVTPGGEGRSSEGSGSKPARVGSSAMPGGSSSSQGRKSANSEVIEMEGRVVHKSVSRETIQSQQRLIDIVSDDRK